VATETSELPRNYCGKVEVYLTVLGWVNVAGLNLAGLLWLWLAAKVRERSNAGRKGAIVFLGVHVLLLGVLLPKIILSRGYAVTLTVFERDKLVEPWVIALVAVAMAAVFLIPMLWLLTPETRAAFERRAERSLCLECGYDLRETKQICPECGRPVPLRHRTAGDVDDVFERMRERRGARSLRGKGRNRTGL
jgi:hypothetical protein